MHTSMPIVTVPRLPLYLASGLALVGFVSGAVTEDGPVLCPFRRCTGGYCPGCGGSRAGVALLRGNVTMAWALHPWTVLICVQLCVIGVASPIVPKSALVRMIRPFVVFNSVIGVAIWVARLATGSIPLPFA
ncbi:MAG: DUF2752 domain-containing protein [Acidimicrobiales bacterium]